jgi:hypothetical protein
MLIHFTITLYWKESLSINAKKKNVLQKSFKTPLANQCEFSFNYY